MKEKNNEWKNLIIDSLLKDSYYGVSDSTNDIGKGYPVLRMGNMNNGRLNFSNLVYLEMDSENFEKFKLLKGDILLNRTNSYELVGKVSIFNSIEKYLCASYIVVLRPDSEIINSQYLNYYLNTEKVQKEIKILATRGVSQANINPTTFKKKISVLVPPKKEQEKIVKIISTWDLLIEKQEQLIEKKKKLKEVLMQKLLTGKVRFKEFNNKWVEVKLGEIFRERVDTGYNNLELLAITTANGVVRRTEVDIKDTSSEDKSKYKRILPGDIGYNTMRMWQGVSGLSKYEGIVSPAYTILEPANRINSIYMSYLFKLPSVINLFYRYSQGLVSDTLNLKYENFKDIKVRISPNFNEQEKIAEVLSESDKEIELLEKELEIIKRQKKGLMQRLLTGEVRVKV